MGCSGSKPQTSWRTAADALRQLTRDGYGAGAYEPEPLTVRLREAEQTLAQLRARDHSRGRSRGRVYLPPLELRVHEIERRIAYGRAHPDLLPLEYSPRANPRLGRVAFVVAHRE